MQSFNLNCHFRFKTIFSHFRRKPIFKREQRELTVSLLTMKLKLWFVKRICSNLSKFVTSFLIHPCLSESASKCLWGLKKLNTQPNMNKLLVIMFVMFQLWLFAYNLCHTLCSWKNKSIFVQIHNHLNFAL